MLGKLLKHEYQATARMMAPTYGILILLTAVERGILAILQSNGLFLFGQASPETVGGTAQTLLTLFGGLTMFVYIVALVAVVFLTVFFLVQRFYKNLLTDEGYLSFTLPVTPAAQVGAKLISAVSWTVLSILMVVLSVLAIFYRPGLLRQLFGALHHSFLTEIVGASNRDFWLTIAWIVFGAVLSLMTQLLLFYVSIAVGHLISAQHKLLASFAAYLVITTAMQMVLLVGVLAIAFGMGAVDAQTIPLRLFQLLMALSTLVYAALDVGMFCLTASIFKKRLNLE